MKQCKKCRFLMTDDTKSCPHCGSEEFETYPNEGAVYQYKGRIYLGTHIGKMKDPMSRRWLEAIVYTNGIETFTREANDFFAKFKKVGL